MYIGQCGNSRMPWPRGYEASVAIELTFSSVGVQSTDVNVRILTVTSLLYDTSPTPFLRTGLDLCVYACLLLFPLMIEGCRVATGMLGYYS